MGPKMDNDSENSRERDKLDELIEETKDLASDIRETVTLGSDSTALQSDRKHLNLFKARLSRLDSTYDKFTKFSYEAKRYARHLKDDLVNQELRALNEEIRLLYYEALAIHTPEQSQLSNSSVVQGTSALKLPVINLPSFDGNISKWSTFRDTFVSLIHDNQELTAVQKFHYLKSSLSGVAYQTISALPTTDRGYPQAWEALTKKFDNKRVQAATCLSKIFNYTPMSRASLGTLQDFSNCVLENAIAFQNLDIEESQGFVLMSFALRLLDDRTRERFEIEQLGKEGLPSLSDFTNFIHNQVSLYQAQLFNGGQLNRSLGGSTKVARSPKEILISTETVAHSTDVSCALCKKKHKLYRCESFLRLTPRQRFQKIKNSKSKVCMNCLLDNHVRSHCPSDIRCKHCSLNHHTLLHFSKREDTPNRGTKPVDLHSAKKLHDSVSKRASSSKPLVSSTKEQDITEGSLVISHCATGGYVLLGTAIGRIQDQYGVFQNVRILIDNGAQRSFITSTCAKRLGLKLSRTFQTLSGFGNQPIRTGKHQTICRMIPLNTRSPEIELRAVITPVITGPMPITSVPHLRDLFSHLKLADQSFWKSDDVDVLIGADVYGEICNGDIYRTAEGGPYALDTIFGWVIMGPSSSTSSNDSVTLLTSVSTTPLEHLVQRFWEIEDVSRPLTLPMKSDDDCCEKHFVETHSRDSTGRYVVRLPFKSPMVHLGKSFPIAVKRFYNLEYKFGKNPLLREEYNKVLREYMDLGYMSVATRDGKYYLPHHGVIKESSTTHLRVVFDASMKTSLGSLNDKLYTGPKMHMDIRIVLINFRKYPVALTADIRHMYLQVLLHPEDRVFQHIVFRFNPSDPLTTYELNRLTFGLSSAPFLAQRTVKQLVIDEGSPFPKASKILIDSIYMDDILTGADSVNDALLIQKELIALLRKGGFELQKWASNHEELLKSVAEGSGCKPVIFTSSEEPHIKILGMQWDPKTDCLTYSIKPPRLVLTKRAVLSAIAKIFDPLGYLAPVVFKAKAFLQQLWNCNLAWDDPIPESLAEPWRRFVEQMNELKLIQIPRCLFALTPKDTQLIGFADASSLGYAAVLYLRIVYSNKETEVKLIAAKTRLAPIKTISIPRLELCGALLLVRLIETFADFITPLNSTSRYLFTDSTVVLSWLRLPPNTLKVFVANRTTEIVTQSKVSDWYHVNTKQNSADIASRGLAPRQLIDNSLWWYGPEWLMEEPSCWPITTDFEPATEIPERLSPKCILLSSETPMEASMQFLERFSTLNKLLAIVGYSKRFLHNVRNSKENRRLGDNLSRLERHEALHLCVKLVQRTYLSKEHNLISNNLGHKSTLKSLAPFVDPLGILRVGGRLSQSPLHYDAKHPMLLPSKCHFTKLVVTHLHIGYLHAGPTLLLSLLNRHFWVIAGRRVVRQIVRDCLTCRRQRPTTLTPYMSDLPSSRFEQGRPFLNVGVDYAGPFDIRESKLRKSRVTKGYMCIYVCLSTKAVHLELVSDLTTNAFLACLDRFIARRGMPSKIFSDHGSNFIGADRHLKAIYQWLRNKDVHTIIDQYLINNDISWVYSPPTASHMSGLWEAGVKSVKSHLNRVLSGKIITFEEMSTLLARVEAILNSRPLFPRSSLPDDYSVLTPGHFLIGDALVAPPEYDYTDSPVNRLTRWQLLSHCLQQIWNKWRLDYLNSLQHRVKWVDKNAYTNITPDTLVLLKESNVSPAQWPTARVIETYPGKDGIVRVVKLKTACGEYVRPVSKIALLLPPNSD